jgi:HlyD family secretion protein
MRNNYKRILAVMAIIILAAIMYGAYYIFQSSLQSKGLVVSGTIEANEIHLGVVTSGIVEDVFVEEGDTVRENQLLAVVKGVSGGFSGRIRAPIDGVVLLRAAEPGEITSAGGSLLVVANLDKMTLTVYVPEDQYGKIYLGQEYPITVDSFPDRVFMGKVTHISDQAEFTPRNVRTVQGRKNTVYAVRLTIPNPNHALKPGMPADVTLNLQ